MDQQKTFATQCPFDVAIEQLIGFAQAELARAPRVSVSLPKVKWDAWNVDKQTERCTIDLPDGKGGTYPCEGLKFRVVTTYARRDAIGGVAATCVASRDARERISGLVLGFDIDQVWDYAGEAIVLTTVAHLSQRLRKTLPQAEGPMFRMLAGRWNSPEMQNLGADF